MERPAQSCRCRVECVGVDAENGTKSCSLVVAETETAQALGRPRLYMSFPQPVKPTVRTKHLSPPLKSENSVVPTGLESLDPLFPALKRWAKFVRPSGAGFSGISFPWIAVCFKLPNYEIANLQNLSQRLLDPLPCPLQYLGHHPGFADDANEIGVRYPARQDVHVDVSGHAGARGFSYVHAEIDAVGPIESAQNRLHPLRQSHHLLGGIGRKLLQLVQVGVGHNHDVPIGVRIGIENDVAMRRAMDDKRTLVAFFGSLAKDAIRLLVGACDI